MSACIRSSAGGLAGGGGDDADARLHHDGAAVEDQRLADRLQQPARRARGGRPTVAGGDDDEAVAFEAEQPVAGLEGLLEPGAGYREERVAGGDAERLVDGAEAVEVEHHQPGGPDGATAAHRGSRPGAARWRAAGSPPAAAPGSARGGPARRPPGRARSGAARAAASARRSVSAGVRRRAVRLATRRKPAGIASVAKIGATAAKAASRPRVLGAMRCGVPGLVQSWGSGQCERPAEPREASSGLAATSRQPCRAQWRRRPPRLPSAGRLERGRALR